MRPWPLSILHYARQCWHCCPLSNAKKVVQKWWLSNWLSNAIMITTFRNHYLTKKVAFRPSVLHKIDKMVRLPLFLYLYLKEVRRPILFSGYWEKKGDRASAVQQKMETSLEHVETEFQLGWPHDTTLCLTWWFNVLWAFLGIDSSFRIHWPLYINPSRMPGIQKYIFQIHVSWS